MADPWAQFLKEGEPAEPDKWGQFLNKEEPSRLSLGQGMAGAEPAPPEKGSDVAKSFGVGLAEGAIGLATLPGNVGELMKAGWNKVAPEALAVPSREASPLAGKELNLLPTASDAKRFIEDNVTGDFYKPKTTAGEYAKSAGEFAPGLLFPGSAMQRVGLNWLGPAVGSEGAGQATKGTAAEPWARVAGGVAGTLLPAAAARAITPVPARSAELTRQAGILEGEGVDALSAGQRTGSKPLRWFESNFGDMPLSGARPAAMMEEQGEQFTRAALRRVGENAPRATPEVVDQAFTRIGGEFDRLTTNNSFAIDHMLRHDITQAVADYNHVKAAPFRAPIVEEVANDVLSNVGRVVDGRNYQATRSALGRLERGTTDPELRIALGDLREALDRGMTRAISPADAEAWGVARQQYRDLLVVERAASAAGENAALGIISPAQLRSASVGQNRRAYARGQSDLGELARAGTAVMSPLPNSGTPARVAAHGAAQIIGAGGGALVGGPPGAAVGAAASMVVPSLVGRAVMSRPAQAYLGNQAMAETMRGTSPAAAVAAQAPTQVKKFEDALKLKKGTRFIDPHGVERVR